LEVLRQQQNPVQDDIWENVQHHLVAAELGRVVGQPCSRRWRGQLVGDRAEDLLAEIGTVWFRAGDVVAHALPCIALRHERRPGGGWGLASSRRSEWWRIWAHCRLRRAVASVPLTLPSPPSDGGEGRVRGRRRSGKGPGGSSFGRPSAFRKAPRNGDVPKGPEPSLLTNRSICGRGVSPPTSFRNRSTSPRTLSAGGVVRWPGAPFVPGGRVTSGTLQAST